MMFRLMVRHCVCIANNLAGAHAQEKQKEEDGRYA